jgi:hypothetical protein
MTLINAQSTSPQAIYAQASGKLSRLLEALNEIQDFGLWLDGISDADLIAIGAVQGDITAMKSAIADARLHYTLYNSGTFTVGQPYITGASQRRFIGPPA